MSLLTIGGLSFSESRSGDSDVIGDVGQPLS